MYSKLMSKVYLQNFKIYIDDLDHLIDENKNLNLKLLPI